MRKLTADLEMPNLSSPALTRRMREVPHGAGLPVVMITSRTSDQHRGEAARAGVDGYRGKAGRQSRKGCRAVFLENVMKTVSSPGDYCASSYSLHSN